METVLQRLGTIGIIPVIRLDAVSDAVALGQALLQGGIPAAEVTFRSDAAEETIAAMTTEIPELLVGAGTVLSAAQADRAIRAGAQFIVSPCYQEEVVAHCLERHVLVIPAITNPDGIARGQARGFETLKFFPAEPFGGTAALDAFSGPFQSMRFIPTGGINIANLASYVRRSNVLAVGGSWMANSDLITTKDWDGIIRLCKESVIALHGFAFEHLEIHIYNEKRYQSLADTISRFFVLSSHNNPNWASSGGCLEITQTPSIDKKGHVTIRCNQLERAVAYLSTLGIVVRPERGIRTQGRRTSIALDVDLDGFSVHLVQK